MRKGDYADPDSLRAAFAGADKLLLISHPSFDHELRVRTHRNAIDAAKAAGCRHVYYTSLAFGFDARKELVPAGEPESVASIMQAHLDTEAYLRTSGLTYTIIREGVYSEVWTQFLGFWPPAEGTNEVVIPHGDGAVAWATRADLGEGTASILASACPCHAMACDYSHPNRPDTRIVHCSFRLIALSHCLHLLLLLPLSLTGPCTSRSFPWTNTSLPTKGGWVHVWRLHTYRSGQRCSMPWRVASVPSQTRR